MIYESILKIDTGGDPNRPRPGRDWLRKRYNVHQRLCMALPSARLHGVAKDDVAKEAGESHRIQYRIMPAGGPCILVRSTFEPDWYGAFKNAPFLLKELPDRPRSVAVDYAPGTVCYFSLIANPAAKESSTKKRRAILEDDAVLAWLHRRGEQHGFEIVAARAERRGMVRTRKHRDAPDMVFHAVSFEGELRVTDTAQFSAGLQSGIGPAKAFGFGMLCVSPV